MKKQKKQKETLREKMAKTLDASKEIVLDVAKITLIGNSEMTVENHKSIIEYTDQKIVLESGKGKILIVGEGLELKSVARELVYITGCFSGLNFRKDG
jgi:sporulation protein YqfC